MYTERYHNRQLWHAFGVTVTILVFFNLTASGESLFGRSQEDAMDLIREYASWIHSYEAKVSGENFHTMKEAEGAVESAIRVSKTRLFYIDCVTVTPKRLSEKARNSLDQRLQSDFDQLRDVVAQGLKYVVDGYNQPDQPTTRKIKASSQEVIDRLSRTKINLEEDDRPTPFVVHPTQAIISESRIRIPTGLIRHLCSRFYPSHKEIIPADADSGTPFADLKPFETLDWRFGELNLALLVLADPHKLQSDSFIPSDTLKQFANVIGQAALLELDFIRRELDYRIARAFVLGHEMAHAALDPYSSEGATQLEKEIRADTVGALLAREVLPHYKRIFSQLLSHLRDRGILPETVKRIENVSAQDILSVWFGTFTKTDFFEGDSSHHNIIIRISMINDLLNYKDRTDPR